MKKSVLKRLFAFIRPYRLYVAGAVISAAVSVGLTLAGPIFVGKGIDFLVGPGQVNFPGVFRILLILAGIYLCSAVFQWILATCTNTVSFRTAMGIRKAAFDKINAVPLKYIDGHAHGDTIARVVNDVDAVSDGLLQGITQLFTGVTTIVGTLVFMLTISPITTAVVVVLTPLSILVAGVITRRSHTNFRAQSATQGELSGYISEMIGNQKIVKTFGYEQQAQQRFEEINARLYKCGFKAQLYSALVNPSTRFVNNTVYVSVGIVGGIVSILTGTLSIGQISAFLTYSNQYTKPFNEISGVMTQLQTAFAAAQRLFDLLDEESEPADPVDAIALTGCEGAVALRDVAFSYSKDRELIRNLNLSVKPGEKVAIVGPTGAGKTTIVNLLMRFYDTDQGSIEVDGNNIRKVTRNSLRKMYGMVLQETWLYGGTIRENIAYGRENATMEEVVAAAKAAHAHSFIKRLPQGYDTVISEGGGNISQGQKQLLCIARVMLVDPPMLILDEATSSIDTRTEIRVQKAFDTLMQGRTTFIVAHRLSTIREADVILVMDHGHIVEQGNHETLLAKKGFYYRLYNSQFAQTEQMG